MAIAGFDPSLTHFGWVVFDERKSGKDAVIESGTFATDTDDGKIGGCDDGLCQTCLFDEFATGIMPVGCKHISSLCKTAVSSRHSWSTT